MTYSETLVPPPINCLSENRSSTVPQNRFETLNIQIYTIYIIHRIKNTTEIHSVYLQKKKYLRERV